MKWIDTRVLHDSSHLDFLALADLELKRAERYRIFVSLLVLDLSLLKPMFGDNASAILTEIAQVAGRKIRCTDTAKVLGDCRLALLFPETPRQNAMVASQRLAELARRVVSERLGRNVDDIIPIEVASYPDTGGAKTVSVFLTELGQASVN